MNRFVLNIYTYIHTYIHTHTHTHITHTHTLHTYTHKYKHTYIHTHTCIHIRHVDILTIQMLCLPKVNNTLLATAFINKRKDYFNGMIYSLILNLSQGEVQ